MSQSRSAVVLVLGLAMALGGCKGLFKKRDEGAAGAAAVAPPITQIAPTPAAPATPAPIEAAKVENVESPVPEDFEEEAFQKITQANFKAEFARLKAEVTGAAGAATK